RLRGPPDLPRQPGEAGVRGPHLTGVPLRRGWAVAPAARRLDHQDVAGQQLGNVVARKFGAGPVDPLETVSPQRARRATGHPVGRHATVAAEQADGHGLQEPQPPYSPVTTPPAAGSPAAASDAVGLQTHRVARLEYLG